MIPHDALVNALRSLKFRFKRQADRVEIYKQSGTTKRVQLRRHDWHDETAARVILKQAGMSAQEIDDFVASTNVTHH